MEEYMERKDYKNIVKSMKLSNNWYFADNKLARELHYGIFVPSNELIIEFLEGQAYCLLKEVINGCEYTKNGDLLYILTEYVLAKWKEFERTGKENFLVDDLKTCLHTSLRTIYRLLKMGVITCNDKKISRVIDDYEENIDLEECKPALETLSKEYFYYDRELSDEARKFVVDEETRLDNSLRAEEKYAKKYIYSCDISDENKVKFITSALKEGIITIEFDGTIKGPFIDEKNSCQLDPELIFMFDEKIQACIIKESIDEGLIRVIEGLDFLKIEKSPEKKYKK